MNEYENLAVSGDEFLMGDWEISPNECTVRFRIADRPATKVTPRAMDVLVYLARYSGQVISADVLLDEFWNGSFATPNAVQKCITELRHAFNDQTRNPRVLRTVPKRGYKLLLTPKPVRSPALPLQPEGLNPSHRLGTPNASDDLLSVDDTILSTADRGSLPPDEVKHHGHETSEPSIGAAQSNRTVLVLVCVMVFAIGAAVVIAWTSSPSSSTRIPVFAVDGNSAAVIVAGNADQSVQPYTDRLNGRLLARLGQRTGGTLSYADIAAASADVTSDLWRANTSHVAHVEVLSTGRHPEVSFQIRPTASSLPSLDERLENKTLEALVTHIADDLTMILDQDVIDEMRRWGTRNVHAYQHAELGASVREHITPNLLKLTQDHFERAIEADPRFASAYSALGGVLNDAWLLSVDTKSRETVRAQSQAVLRAARINGISTDVVLGLEQLHGRLSAASPRDNETYWRQQLLEDPKNVQALRRYSEILLSGGLPGLSRRYLERAISLASPEERPWLEMGHATVAGAQGNVQEEINLCKQNLERFPDFTISTFCLVRNLARAGDYLQAEWYLERLRESDPEERWAYGAELTLRAIKGELPAGSAALRAALEDPKATNLARGNTCFMVGEIACGVRYWSEIEPGMLPLLWEFNVTQEWYWAEGVIEDLRYQELLDQLGMGKRWRSYVRARAEELGKVTGIAATSSAPQTLTAAAS